MKKIKSVKEYIKGYDKYSVLIKVGKTHPCMNGIFMVQFDFGEQEILKDRGKLHIVPDRNITYDSTTIIRAEGNIPFFTQVKKIGAEPEEFFSVILDFRIPGVDHNFDQNKLTQEFVVTAKFD